MIELAIQEQKPWADIQEQFIDLDRGCNSELHTYWGEAAELYQRIEVAIEHYNKAILCYGWEEEKTRIQLQQRISILEQ